MAAPLPRGAPPPPQRGRPGGEGGREAGPGFGDARPGFPAPGAASPRGWGRPCAPNGCQRSLAAAVPPPRALSSSLSPAGGTPGGGSGQGQHPPPPACGGTWSVGFSARRERGSHRLTSPSLAPPPRRRIGGAGPLPFPRRGSARSALRGQPADAGWLFWSRCWWDRKALGPSGDRSEEGRWICFGKGVGFLAVGAYCERRFPWHVVVVIKGQLRVLSASPPLF